MQTRFQLRLVASLILGGMLSLAANAQLPPPIDPEQEAFYYARVIEIPTPRWSTLEAFRFGMPIPDGAPVSTQERAYTSPIWYAP